MKLGRLRNFLNHPLGFVLFLIAVVSWLFWPEILRMLGY